MSEPNDGESGKFPVTADHESFVSQAVAKTTDEIIDAAAALFTNVGFLADMTDSKHKEVVVDARASIERIVRLARSLRSVAKCSPHDVESARRTAR
jgi:hypothetical protein